MRKLVQKLGNMDKKRRKAGQNLGEIKQKIVTKWGEIKVPKISAPISVIIVNI